jgi:RNA polymerase sigma factor (sigma-70 family)
MKNMPLPHRVVNSGPLDFAQITVSAIIKPITNAHLDEILLLMQLRAHKQSSFQKLYKSYSAALLGIISRIVKHDEEAEDILQETFVKIVNNLHLYDPDKSRFFTWMAKVAKHKAIDHIRSAAVKKGDRTIDVSTLHDDRQLHINCINIDAIGVKQLICNLTSTQRNVIDLLYFNGYTQKEVAEKLAIPLGTVKTKARQAINILRAQFV